MTVRRADIHQHLWPDGLLSSLARRTVAPRLRRDGRELVARARGRRAGAVRPARSTTRATPHRLRTAIVIAPSRPLGIESLPEAEALLDDFHRGVLELGAPFELWASLVLADPARVRRRLLDAGAVGLSLPAGALGGPAGIERSAPALERLAPRPRRCSSIPGPAAGSPAWFPALTAYVAEMSTAWHAWAQWGRPAHPTLRVVFAMLAGLAPLHAERLAARGGPSEAVHDPLTSFDTSSYGPRAIDAMLRVVGVDRLLYGSDRPGDRAGPARGARRGGRARPRRHQPGARRCERARRLRPGVPRPRPGRRSRQSGSTSCSHSADQRHYEELRRDDDVAVWLICWMDDHDTGFHDHDLSGGAVAVVAGRGRRGPARARRSAGHARRSTRARRFTSAPPTSTASATPATRPAVTIHAYSPPLWRMGAYEILPGGELRRHSLSYAEELRPLA